jgi:hypothetical protein
MDEAQFWSIIDGSRELARQKTPARGQDFMDLHEQTLADMLRQLSPAEISAFDERFWEAHQRAYRWDLWAAAYWLHGGCGNDGFTDFRSCLISLGRQWYQRILADPDALAERIDMPDTPYMQSEGFQYIASRVYREKTGEYIPQEATLADTAPPEPAGTRLDHDDADVMREHFPRLVARFPDMGD